MGEGGLLGTDFVLVLERGEGGGVRSATVLTEDSPRVTVTIGPSFARGAVGRRWSLMDRPAGSLDVPELSEGMEENELLPDGRSSMSWPDPIHDFPRVTSREPLKIRSATVHSFCSSSCESATASHRVEAFMMYCFAWAVSSLTFDIENDERKESKLWMRFGRENCGRICTICAEADGNPDMNGDIEVKEESAVMLEESGWSDSPEW